MAVFVMQPVITFGEVSEQNLNQAETKLQELKKRLSVMEQDPNPSIERLKQRLIDILHQDKAEERDNSDQKQALATKMINDLTVQSASLNEQLNQEKSTLLRSQVQEPISIEEVSEWQRKRVAKLEGLHYDGEHQLAQFVSELDSYTLQANSYHTDLHSTFLECNELIAEDQKLYSPDRRAEIEKEIQVLRKKITTLAKKAADICKVPHSGEFNFTEMIDKFETDLKTIQSRLGMIDVDLENPVLNAIGKQVLRSAKKQQPDEMEGMIHEIKKLVKDKTLRLRQLNQLKSEVIKLSQLEKTARLDLKGEQSRMEKQNSRTRLIKELKTNHSNLKQKLESVKEKIIDIETKIEKSRKNLENISNQKQFYQQQLDKILSVAAALKECESKLAKEKNRLSNIKPSSVIWHESIQYRIKKVRRNIDFGNPLVFLLLPYRSYCRYQLGLKIRKHLVLTERALQRLGILSREYVEQVDIFNRANRKGQRMCLDILSC